MKFKGILVLVVWAALSFGANAQSSDSESFVRRYDYLVSKVGYAGVGVETLLNTWAKADSLDRNMLIGRFNYYLTKSQRTEVVIKDERKYLGMNPLLTLKDSTGKENFYYQETFYDDSLFSMAMQSLDKVIALEPDRIDFRFSKAATLVSYEKDSPDMALSYLFAIIDMDAKGQKKWEYPDGEMTGELFRTVIQEYCNTFYQIGSASAYEAFRGLSEKMAALYPKDPTFLSNLGTYYFVVVKENKTAYKFYNKALKADPTHYPSIKNCVLMARRAGDLKSEKKYLKMMAEHGPQTDAMSAEARLNALNQK